MAREKTRGLTAGQEMNEEFLYRDTRSMATKVGAWLRGPNNMAMVIVMHAALVFLYPGFGDIALIVAGLLLWWGMRQREECPIKMPIQSQMPDPHQIHPGNGKRTEAEGIIFLGNELSTGKATSLPNADCRQPFLNMGTTADGRALTDEAPIHPIGGWPTMAGPGARGRIPMTAAKTAKDDRV